MSDMLIENVFWFICKIGLSDFLKVIDRVIDSVLKDD